MLEAFANYDFETFAKTWSSSNCFIRWGTTLIGDPSGKDSTRKILNKKEIKKNIIGIKKIFNKLLFTKNKKTKPIYVDNFSG